MVRALLPRRRLALVFALVALALGGWLLLVGGPRRLLVGWFGPPRVAATEAYETAAGGPEFDHSLFDRLLHEVVDDEGFVDYAALGRNQADLNTYLESLASAPFGDLGRNGKLALLINAYNAFTLELILEHYPLASIRDIPTKQRWDAVRWDVGGKVYSLNQIEHEQIRPNFREPRIHFALVCAAVGCPPLRGEAYAADRLDEQLEQQTRRVHRDRRWFRFSPESGNVELTSLYEWYRGDFEQADGTMLDHAARYREDLAAALESGERPEVEFLDYDWSLNDRPAR